MNIVFLLRYWPIYGGGETVTRILSNKLVELGYSVSIVYLWDKRQDDMPFIDERIREYKIDGIAPPKKVEDIRKGSFSLIRNFLKDFFVKNNTDIIINQWLPAKEVYRAKKVTKAKMICCHHTNVIPTHVILTLKHKTFYFMFGNYGVKIRNRLIKYRLHNTCKYSDRLIFLSDCFIDDVRKLFKKHIEKIGVVHNPLTYNYFLSPDELENKQKEILYVGRINENKRVEYIIEAWSRLEKKNNLNEWRLTIIGSGAELEDIKRYTKTLGCKRVSFAGQQIPVPYYQRASLFAFASANEGWAVVLLEAQQYGCVPVAMDSYQSLHEIIQHGHNGVIVKNNDIQGFSDALEHLMLDDEYRRRLSLKSLETCKRFSIDKVMQQWEILFNELSG